MTNKKNIPWNQCIEATNGPAWWLKSRCPGDVLGKFIPSNNYVGGNGTAHLWLCIFIFIYMLCVCIYKYTSSTAQGGGGSFKNRKPIGEIGCCESGMAERSHWWTERCLISLTLSLSFSDYLLPTYLLCIYLSIDLSIYLSIYLPIYLPTYLSIYRSIYLPF